MSSKLEQALIRLDQTVEALEQVPPVSAAPASEGQHLDDDMKAEINAIRSLVDDAMALLDQQGKPDQKGAG